MSIPSIWPPKSEVPVKGVARFSGPCPCGANEWTAVSFGDGIGWACLACGNEDTDHPRVAIPEGDRTEEDL